MSKTSAGFSSSGAASNAAGQSSKEAERKNLIQQVLSAKTHYEVLGLPQTAEDKDVRSSYKRFVLLIHPDKVCQSAEIEKQRAEQAFRAVQVAYETLSDEKLRRTYDSQVRSGGGTLVPGEGTAPDAYEATNTVQFFSVLITLFAVMALGAVRAVWFVGSQACSEALQVHTARGMTLKISILCSICLWKFLGLGFWTSWLVGTIGYGGSKLVTLEMAIQAQAVLLAGVLHLTALQLANWNRLKGVPLYVGAWRVVDLYNSLTLENAPYSFLGASLSGAMTFGSLLMGVLVPQMSFGQYTVWILFLLDHVCVYWFCAEDVHAALFIAVLAWHFLQGLPEICLVVLGLIALFLAYKISALLLVLVAVAAYLLAPSPEGGGGWGRYALGTAAALIWLHGHGLRSAALASAAAWGAKGWLDGSQPGAPRRPYARRTLLTSGLLWCLDCGWMSGITIVAVLFFAGALVQVVADEETSSSGGGGGSGGDSGGGSAGEGGGGRKPRTPAGGKKANKSRHR